MQPDILVVGGGPAGLAAAIACAQKGFRVTVVDSRKPPINKPCGEGLLPQAVDALRTLGVHLHSSLGHPFEGFRFVDDSHSVTAPIAQGQALGLRRTVLHQLLIERAEACGVELLWGAHVSSLESRGAGIDGRFLPFRYLIGADGQNSSVRAFAHLGSRWTIERRFGFRRHYAVAPWTNLVEVHWARRSQMVVTPTGERRNLCFPVCGRSKNAHRAARSVCFRRLPPVCAAPRPHRRRPVRCSRSGERDELFVEILRWWVMQAARSMPFRDKV